MDTAADRGDCRQGPCKSRSSSNPKRRPHPHFHLAATHSMKLEPWSLGSEAQAAGGTGVNWNSGSGGGAWIKAPSIAVPPVDYYGYGNEDTESTSPRGRGSQHVSKKLVLASRDKESLLEEIIDLKKALADQARHLKLHKVHSCSVELENRKLEKDVEDLELAGSGDGPRTGGITRMRAKIQGLKTRCGDLQSTCDAQHEELCLLRRDIRITRTREIEVERDVFAGEITRLQKLLKRMRGMHNRISCENRELGRLKDKSCRLEMANTRLESCISVVHKTLERANREVQLHRHKANESALQAKRHGKRCKELEDHAALLEGLLEQERIEKRKLQKRIHDLEEELANMAHEKETRPNSRSDLRSRGGPVGESWGFGDDKGGSWDNDSDKHHRKHKKVHHGHHDDSGGGGGGLFSGFFGGGGGSGGGGGGGGGEGGEGKTKAETDAAARLAQAKQMGHGTDSSPTLSKLNSKGGNEAGGGGAKAAIPKLNLDGLDDKSFGEKLEKDSKPILLHDKHARGMFDENRNPIKYTKETIPKDKEGRPLFDKKGNSIFYDKQGAIIPTNKDGKPLFDEKGRPLFDKDGNPIPYDKVGFPNVNDKASEYESKSRHGADDKSSKIGKLGDDDDTFDKNAKPIPLHDKDERALFDKDHNPIVYDAQNEPIPRDKQGKPLFARDGSAIYYDKKGTRIPTNKDGLPLFDENGRPLFDKDGNPIYYDKDGNMVDKYGNLISKGGKGGFGEGFDKWGNKLGSPEAERKRLEELAMEKDKYHITVNETNIEKNEFEFDKDKDGNVSIDILLKSSPGEPSDLIMSPHELELLAQHKEVAKSTETLIHKHMGIKDDTKQMLVTQIDLSRAQGDIGEGNNKAQNDLLEKQRKLNDQQGGVLDTQLNVSKTMEDILEKHIVVAKAIEKEITNQEVKAALRASHSEGGKKVSIKTPTDTEASSEGKRKQSKKASKIGLLSEGSHDGHSSEEGSSGHDDKATRKSISHTGSGGDPHRQKSISKQSGASGHADAFARGKAKVGHGTPYEDESKFASDTKQRISVREDMAPERLGGHGEEYLDLQSQNESLDDIKKSFGEKLERHSFLHHPQELANVHEDVKGVLQFALESVRGHEGEAGQDGSGKPTTSGAGASIEHGAGASIEHDASGQDSASLSRGGSARKKPGHLGAGMMQLGFIKENMKEVLEHLDTIKEVLVHRKEDDPPPEGHPDNQPPPPPSSPPPPPSHA